MEIELLVDEKDQKEKGMCWERTKARSPTWKINFSIMHGIYV